MSEADASPRPAGEGAAGRPAGEDASPRPADGAAAGAPVRVRVTAPRAGERGDESSVRPRSQPSTGATDTHAVYARALIRTQLATALVFAAGFVVATVLFAVGVALIPDDADLEVLGVPVSWLLLGFGVYPLLLTVAALYVRAAGRNEDRFRSLVDDGGDRDRSGVDSVVAGRRA